MKKSMKLCSIALAVALVFSTLSLNALAPVSATTESLMICACDTLTGWTKLNGDKTFVLTDNRAQAQSDDGAIGTNVGYGFLQAYYEFPEAVDVSDYTAIEWDVGYTGSNGISEVLTTYATAGYVRIFSNGNSPTNTQSNSLVFRFDSLEVTSINATWAHVKATFENATVKRNFDPTALTAFRFYTSENTYNNAVKDGAMRLDNIMVTGKEVAEIPETVTITDCEAISGWATESPSNANLQLASGRGKDSSNAVYAAGGYGALRKLTYTLPTAKDISDYSTIEWDMQSIVNVSGDPQFGNDEFASIAAAYSSYMAIELSDGTNTDIFAFNTWEIGDAGADKYRHFATSLAGATIDTTALTSVSIYVLPLGTGTVNTSVLTAFFRFDNFIVSNNPVTVNADDYMIITTTVLNDCETGTGWSIGSGGTLTAPAANGASGKCVQAYGPKGAVPAVTYTFDTPADLHRYGYVDFDIRFLKAGDGTGADYLPLIFEKYGDSLKFTLTDNDGNYFDYTKSKISLSDPGTNNWYKITLSFNRASSSSVDFSKIKTIKFFISTVQDNSISFNVNMRIDNIRALPRKDLVLGDVNGDEGVNVRDMMRLKKYLIGEDVEVFEDYADIYSSASINELDLREFNKLILGFELLSGSYPILSMSGWSNLVKP